ncbi:MAG: L-serine ammonia-lyase [Rhodospirillaceae bacterium]|nr:L-serine ammonia-lyase [Rhodospirillaceae bacterium]
MFLSVFEIFKVGIGPSSSHTMGPMTAATRFLEALSGREDNSSAAGIKVTLHGSLAFAGKGHATDRAVALGLLGYTPDNIDYKKAEQDLSALNASHTLHPEDLPQLHFNPDEHIVFDYGPALPGHPNGLLFETLGPDGTPDFSETYYSIGGGFVVTAAEHEAPPILTVEQEKIWPYPFDTAASMIEMARKSGSSIAEMKRANERVVRSPEDLDAGLSRIWETMNDCIGQGLAHEGELPGSLRVKRRAKKIFDQLNAAHELNSRQPHEVFDWLNVYAMAVNEENAAGGVVVTAPTNGAAGVIPAVIRYYLDHCIDPEPDNIPEFLLTAAAIGGLIKHNASISGAETGCQGEVGSASAMAAAGLCAVLGGSPEKVENAAEIALEHHLGMTCDPVAGLVQVPCIERNGMGATKAVAAASLALRGDGSHFMPLDNCIEAMRQIGAEMSENFRETSLGGLAVNVPEC